MNYFIFIISAVASTGGFLLGAFVIKYARGYDKPTAILLGMYMVLFSVGLSEPLWDYLSMPKAISKILSSYAFALGPTLFLYVKVHSKPLKKLDLIHFIPFLLYFFAVIQVEKVSLTLELILYELFIAQIIMYSIFSIYLSASLYEMPMAYASRLRREFTMKWSKVSLVLFTVLGVLSNLSLLIPVPGALIYLLQFAYVVYLFLITIVNPELQVKN